MLAQESISTCFPKMLVLKPSKMEKAYLKIWQDKKEKEHQDIPFQRTKRIQQFKKLKRSRQRSKGRHLQSRSELEKRATG